MDTNSIIDVEKKEILHFFKKIGVDTRFVSVVPPNILINNHRFSKFSRTKEELFKKNYPEMKVIRSTVFQKICARASKVLGESLNPRERILINKSLDPSDKALSVILEPYTRKYGITIIEKEFNLNENDINEEFDSIALPLTLDHEVENILGQIFTGEKVKLESSQNKWGDKKIIYPLINVPLEWICSWQELENCTINEGNELAHEFLAYLESVVPQVRENIRKSGRFLTEDIE
ncbi:MAG: ATPase [Methanobacteriales archaeon HGW-Methanobacteriales-1]|jgi:hypothetical protein|nr:MAG: ATPase [Methanobacteriales archaeon HGW-Methanobacteriales-1]